MQQHTHDIRKNELAGLLPSVDGPSLAATDQPGTFTAAVFEPTDRIEIRVIESWQEDDRKRSTLIERFWIQASKIANEVPRLCELNTLGGNVYFGVNPRMECSGRKQSVRVIRSIWMDMDGVTLEDASASWRPHVPGEPSIVVSSGHGIHAYWLLKEPFHIQNDSSRNQFEAMLKAIYRRVGCDAVQDVCRVLRMPGFANAKGLRSGVPSVPCTLLECDRSRTYPFSTFGRWWEQAQRELAPETIRERRTSTPAPEDLKTKDLLAELDRSVRDRSRRDFAIIIRLLQSGLASEEIWPLVEDRSKFKTRGREYFDVTIRNAMRVLKRTE